MTAPPPDLLRLPPRAADAGPRYVGFDIDGFMADCTRMAEAVGKHIGQHVDVTHWTTYGFAERYGISLPRFLDLLVEERVLETMRPMPNLRRAMEYLHEHDLKVAVVSARAFHPRGEVITRQWLEEQGVSADRLVLVAHNETKAHALHSTPNLVAYGDDYLKHLHELRRSGLTAPLYVMDQPWNRDDDTFVRVHDPLAYVQAVVQSLDPTEALARRDSAAARGARVTP